ncbi:MAG TPA: STAS domain-containing protein [Pyrinomonadaceae bacterium]|nr:STAS domain-containing protein [Pyrinomonadaceae bacterium]
MLQVHAKNLETFTVLCVQGQIVTGETEVLRTAFQSLPDTRRVVLDLAKVNIVDAHGLGVLLDLRQRALANGSRFELMNVSQPLRRIFEITRLDSVFDITYGVEFFPAVSRPRRASVTALKPCA